MADTIKGGAYQSADGTWHDANGKPLSDKQVQEAQKLQAEKADEVEEAEAKVEAGLPLEPLVVKPTRQSRKNKG